MPREALIQIINGNRVVELISILLVFFAVDWVIFRLIFQILGIEKKTQKLLPGILLVVFYNTCGKQILPIGLAYSLTLIGLLVILIKVISRDAVTWMQAFWSSFLTYFIVGLGVVLIEYPLFSISPTISHFITTTPLGIAVGTILCEGIIPLITLFLLKTIDISIIPPVKRKMNLLDAANLYLFAGMFALLYNSSAQLLKNIETTPRLEIVKGVLYQLFITVSLIVVYYFVYTTTKKQRDRERRQYELDLQQLEEEKRRYELKLKMERERAGQLESEKNEISAMYEQLKSKKIDPNEAFEGMLNLFERLETSVKAAIEQQKSFSVPGNNGAPLNFHLTDKEKDVVRLLLKGMSNKEIAAELHNSEKRIKNIVSSICGKMEVADRTQLVLFVMKHNLLPPDDSEPEKK
jgi:DNA-binding CsgD family transcriptional regulator